MNTLRDPALLARRSVASRAASLALLAVLTVLIAGVVSGCSDDPGVPPPSGSTDLGDPGDPADPPALAAEPNEDATRAPDPTPAPVRRLPADLLAEDARSYVDVGETVRFTLGGHGIIEGNELVVTESGRTYRTDLGELSGTARLSPVKVQLGQAGTGYLVDDGDGEYSKLRLYLGDRDGGMVRAEVTGGVPFGNGFTRDDQGYLTWTTGTGAGLFTRVMVGDPSQGRYRIYRWQVPGPGEGGQRPDNTAVELVPTALGTVCIDGRANTYERC